MVAIAKATPFQANYQVALLDTDGTMLDILPTNRIQNLSYTRIINDYGDFTITISALDAAASYAQTTDLIVEIYRENIEGAGLQLEGTYLSRFYNVFEDENGQEWVIFAGYGLEHFLARRVLRPEDDPNSAGGLITYFGVADSLMRSLVLYQCVTPANDSARAISGLTVTPVDNIGFTWFVRKSYENLLDVLKEGAVKGVVDFWITRTTDANFEFNVGRRGTDRTRLTNYPSNPFVQFDPRRGNIFNPNLSVDRKAEKTFAYVLGQGLEDERYIFPVSVMQAGDSPWNRIEISTDSRTNEDDDTDGLYAAGLEALNDQGRLVEFSFEPNLNAAQGRYNIDWYLGDKVTAYYRGYTESLRIIKISIEVTGDGERVTPELKNDQDV